MKIYISKLLLLVLLSFNASALDMSEKDKQKHFGAETAIVSVSSLILKDSEHPILYPILVGTIIGYTKELYDSRKGGSGFSDKDLEADSLGIAAGSLVGSGFNVILTDKFVGFGFRKEFN